MDMKQLERITLARMVAALAIMQAATLGVLAILIVQSRVPFCHF